jgi:predicted enzyme related to lactoylglutathione lyase
MKAQGTPPNWLSHVWVTSADEAVKRTRELGGSVDREPFDVLDLGRKAVISDPTGATLAVWESRAHMGAQLVNEPGALTWNELMTTDMQKAAEFYTGLFGWKTKVEVMPTGPYTMYLNVDRPAAGMMAITPEMGPVPAHWSVYFGIDDCDGAARKAESLGARILVPPTDIPEVGQFAVMNDPQGAMFSVIQLRTPA